MTSTYPAIRGKFGSTEYHLVTLKVGDVIRHVINPTEISGWEDLSLEEKYQRELNIKRVTEHIAPYFACDKDRFSGSLILAIQNPDNVKFEQMSKFTEELPVAYDSEDMGFLTISGEEVFIPLDGQHRVEAFKMAINGRSEYPVIKPNIDLAKDMVTAILINFDVRKSRYIFNKINKYAKPTTKATNLITNDDDAVAVITRTLITNNVIPYRLVNTKSNSLNKKSPVFTTMSTIYEANIALIKGAKIPSAVAPASIPYAERDKLGEELSAEWRALINGIGKWKKMLGDPSEKGDGDRIKIRKESLLGWPIGQLSLFNGYSFACQRDRGIDRSMLVRKLNRINWNQNSKIWNEILVHPNKKIMSGKTIMNNASKVVAHMIGAGFTKKEKMEILYSIYGKKRGKTLPNQIKL